jgi:RHS repeat-associated protein
MFSAGAIYTLIWRSPREQRWGGLKIMVHNSCALAVFGSPGLSSDNSAEQISHASLFKQPLLWVGNVPPSASQSAALLEDINVFKTQGQQAGFSSLEQYVETCPNSSWTPALEVHLAEHDRAIGRYSEALAYWQMAWDATKDGKSATEQKLAVEAIAGWTRLLASLGEKAQLRTLFNELDDRHLPLGPYSTEIGETREGLNAMYLHPDRSYRCGSFALGHLAMALHCDKGVIQRLFALDSPDGGFNMANLLEIARTNGLQVVAVRRPLDAPLVVPSVVHWKLNHFAAIIEEDNGLYRVEDPTFERDVWMDLATINAEASGDFILPEDKMPASWKKLSRVASTKIYGKGEPNLMNDADDDAIGCGSDSDDSDDTDDSNCDPPASQDGASKGGGNNPPGSCCDDSGDSFTNAPGPGMPQWRVSEPYISLWLDDVPLLYRLSNGKWMKLKMAYKSRGEAQSPNLPGFGDKWSCNWMGMLEKQLGQGGILDYEGGGGQRWFLTNGTPDYKTARIAGTYASASEDPPGLETPYGAKSLYGCTNSLLDGTTDYLLTQRLDRYGRVLEQMNYLTNGTVIQLTNVLDMDGKTNLLSYDDALFPNLITSITDPYGNTTQFKYKYNGLLTNIIDAQGMSTFFQYDTDENIISMTTAYGTSSFQYAQQGNGTNSPLDRALVVTEASGDQQLFMYLDQSPTDFGDRSVYHWNRAETAAVGLDWSSYGFSMPTADLELATVKHFLHGDPQGDNSTVSDTMDQIMDPENPVLGYRPNHITYTYQGQNGDFIGANTAGGLKRITSVTVNNAKVLDITVNSLGRPTSYTYYGPSGSATYTNIFDASGMILKYELGPQGELTRGYGYDPVVDNLLTSVTNAAGDVIRYTHDSTTLKLTSTTFPGGLLRTNVFYTGGPNQGFLAMQADVGFRTNYYSYTNGNVFIQTNALGLVTTNAYDNLNRLLSITYPDGTTASNVYHALDIVATKDRLNQWTYYHFNNVRQLIGVTNVDGQVTTISYCGCGSPDEIVQWNGASPMITYLNYEPGGFLTNVIYPDNYQLNYTYDAYNNPVTVMDGSGNEIYLYWVQYGLENLLQTADMGTGQLFTRQFDPRGRIYQEVNRNAVTVTNGYDFLDRLIARRYIGSDGSTQTGLESFNYNWLGLTNYVDQLGHVTAFVRDASGRVTSETNANNEVLQFTYNPFDELLTLTDGKNQTTTWHYDQYGHATNKVDASSTTDFVYQYDLLGRLTNRWTPAKGTTVYRYDPLGNLTNVDYSGGTVATPSLYFAYDPLNRLTNMLDGIGSTAFGWTPGNQLASESGPWLDDAVNYAYNSARQRSSLSLSQFNANPWVQTYGYDSVMRLSTVTSPAATGLPWGTFNYAYANPAGDRVAQINFPAPSGSYSYVSTVNSYDALARLTQTYMNPPSLSSLDIHNYAYDMGSEVTQQVFEVGNYINYTYDNIGQLKTAKGMESDGVTARLQEQFGYAYDSAWNLAGRTNNAFVKSFSVNSVNEITTAGHSGTYTVAGSATENASAVSSVTVNGQPASLYGDSSFAATGFSLASGNNTFTAIGSDTYGRSSTNAVTAYLSPSPSYNYDSNGNLTNDGVRNFGYDDENELVAVWVSNAWSNSFAYDGLQRRRIETDFSWNGSAWLQTNEVYFVYDGNLVLQERNQNNLALTTYTRGVDLSDSLQGAGGIGGLLARSDSELVAPAILLGGTENSQSVVNSYFHDDGRGNVTALLEPNGFPVANYEYDPFGNMISMSGLLAAQNKYRFSSKEWNDNAGLYYYGYRFYDPNMQRWLNRDPIQEWGGINLFGFVGNNPLKRVDVFGESCGAAAPAGAGTGETLGGNALRAIGRAAAAVGPDDVAAGVIGAAAFGAMVYGPYINGVGNWYETNPNGVNAPPESVESPQPLNRSNLPARGGPPNGSLAEDYGNGSGQIRDYDSNGDAKTDYDFGHDHTGAGDPHAHDWDWTNPQPRGTPRPLCPGE